MAEVLENFEFSHGSKAKYPWHQWLDGRIWKLTKGIDFDVSPSSFSVSAHQRANREGKKLRTSTSGDSITIQSYEPEPSP